MSITRLQTTIQMPWTWIRTKAPDQITHARTQIYIYPRRLEFMVMGLLQKERDVGVGVGLIQHKAVSAYLFLVS